MLKTLLLTFVALILAAPARAQAPAATLHQARADVDTLASARYAGRGYAGPEHARGGAARAAAYVARRFDALGLRPFDAPPVTGAPGDAPTRFLRPFAFETDLVDRATLSVGGRTLRLGDDFLPHPGAASGAGEAPSVDAGAGLVLGPLGIDAYAGRDVAGRVVVLSQPVPDTLRARADVPATALSDEVRLEIAAAMGAAAVVLLADDLPAYRASGYRARVPVFVVRRAAWAGGGRARFGVEARQGAVVAGHNVAGYVAGTAQPESLLVVTAHLDHLGMIDGDAPVVFPGANDNASGVSLLLALAEAVARAPLRYTVVFVATGGEERGLHGAEAFAADPPFPLGRVRFLLNFDMVASGTAGLLAFGAPEFPAEYALLTALNDGLGRGPLAPRGNRPNSDHFPFTQRGVRAFFLLANGGLQPYHTPRDVPETLEWDDWEHVYVLARAFLNRLAG